MSNEINLSKPIPTECIQESQIFNTQDYQYEYQEQQLIGYQLFLQNAAIPNLQNQTCYDVNYNICFPPQYQANYNSSNQNQNQNLQNQPTRQELEKNRNIGQEYCQEYLEGSLIVKEFQNQDQEIEQQQPNFFITHNDQIIFRHPFKFQKEDQDYACFVFNILNEIITVINLVIFLYDDNQLSYIKDSHNKNIFERGSYYAKIYQKRNALDNNQLQIIDKYIVQHIENFLRSNYSEEQSIYDDVMKLGQTINKIQIF